MKLIFGVIVILLGVASVCISQEPQPDDGQDIVRVLNEECQKTSGVDPETLRIVEEENLAFPETDEWKDHALCLFKGLGFINDDGTINADNVRTSLEYNVSKERAEEITTKCNVQKDTREDTAYWLGRCIHAELERDGFY